MEGSLGTSGEPFAGPMLARLARELPTNGFLYEPKWDGFRCLAARDGDEVQLWSRHGRPLARYFPEVVEGLRALRDERFAVDGEVVITAPRRFDFAALMTRVHPASSRVQRLSRETPAALIAFDLLAEGDGDVTARPFEERRGRLETLLGSARPPILLTPITGDVDVAGRWLDRFEGGGVDGVVAKHRDLPYRPNARAMVKVKRERTAECVVAGFRWLVDRPALGSLLLGLYDEHVRLRHVGVVVSFTGERRREVERTVEPLVTSIEGHPWERGFALGRSPLGRLAGSAGRWTPDMELEWVPLRPELVLEVAFDQVDEGRFRHPARFRRWRPDREPGSCTLDQLEVAEPPFEALLPELARPAA